MEPLIMNGNSNMQTGFAYMALLVVIFSSLLVLTKAMPDIYQMAKREREAQLFFVGQQYQRAIEHFYENRFVAIKRYPRTFEELLADNRSPKVQRYLRKLYPDPITQTNNWGLILNEEDQIMGVYSLSNGQVLKKQFAGGRVTISNVAGAEQYSDLKFVYVPSYRINKQ